MPFEFGIPLTAVLVITGGFLVVVIGVLIAITVKSLRLDAHSPPPLQDD